MINYGNRRLRLDLHLSRVAEAFETMAVGKFVLLIILGTCNEQIWKC